jgi:hypothetical protein
VPEIIHTHKKQEKENVMSDEDIVDVPMPIIEPKEQAVGNFPALANKLQEELGSYLNRQRAAINKVLDVTREKTEFLEAMAEKTEEDLKNEKRTVSRALGNI